MFERMLDKTNKPTLEEMLHHAGESAQIWRELDRFLESCEAEKTIRFPYGKKEGWGVKYAFRARHICDIFAEAEAFTVFFRIKASDFESIKDELTEESLAVWECAYPCGDGGWLRYRVTRREQLGDLEKLLKIKAKLVVKSTRTQ